MSEKRTQSGRRKRRTDPFGARRLSRRERHLLAVISLAGVLIVWWIVTAAGVVNPILLPPPAEILQRFVVLVKDGTLVVHIWASLSRVVMGFLLAAAIAIPVGVTMGMSATVRGLLEPLVELIRPIPPIAVIPVTMLWLGIGEMSKTSIIAFGAFFPILINTIAGFAAVDAIHIRAAQTLGANRYHIFRDVVLRSALPYIVVGARLGMGLAFIVLVAAELIASSEGLGYLINDARYRFNTADIFVGMICIGLLGFVLNKILLALERRMLRWRQSPVA